MSSQTISTDCLIFDAVPAALERAQKELEGIDFDTLVGVGISGAVFVPVLADRLGKNYVLVRKNGEKHCGTSLLTGKLGDKWLFVDDFTQTGTTLRHAQREIRETGLDSHYVGGYYYQDNYWGGEAGLRLEDSKPHDPFESEREPLEIDSVWNDLNWDFRE